MSSRRGVGKTFASAAVNGSSTKGKNVPDATSANVEQLTHGVADVSLDSAQQDDGQWEVIARKGNKSRAGSSAAKQWVPQNSHLKTWGHQEGLQKAGGRYSGGSGHGPGNSNAWSARPADPKKPAGRGNLAPQSSASNFENSYRAPQTAITPPLEHGWNWSSRAGSQQPRLKEETQAKDDFEADKDIDIADDDEDNSVAPDYSDDELLSDEFDSDTSDKSHNTLKKSKWFAKFFKIIDELKIEEVNDPERQWHCPACQGGPGAIEWYRGLQPLMTHAKTKGGERMKLHRKLAELLEEELQKKGTSVIPPGEAFGRWEGLQDEEKDHEIIWPPMVVIMNTKLEQDEKDKWIGMGNQELLEYFSSYHPIRARHSYGPQGHRGMSVLIFEASARGYLEAERLHKHFAKQGTDRNAWINNRILFYHGGKRQLYGYLATKEDLDVFNQHSQGKSKLKYELGSYQGMVVNQIRQMSEDNQQLSWYKDKYDKEQRHSKAVEESLDIVSQQLRQTIKENRIVRQRTKLQHEENREEMYLQEQFFKDQIKIIHESREAKEENFERLQQEERQKVKQSSANTLNAEEGHQRTEEISNFIKSQDKEMENYVAQREALTKAHKEKIDAMKKRHWEEEVALEEEFNAELTRLMSKYSPLQPEDTTL